MATAPDTHTNILETIFDSPFAKGAVAALTAGGAIVAYVKRAGERERRTKGVATHYRFGTLFAVIAWFPFLLHLLIAYLILVAALLGTVFLLAQGFFGTAVALPVWANSIINFFSSYIVLIFLLAAALYLLFELRVIERLLGFIVGLVPYWRQSLDWPNAMWQIAGDGNDRPVLGESKGDAEQYANIIINELTTLPRSSSFALRPTNLSDDSAANVLYFGHVIESYCAANLKLTFPWTLFYQALANVAEDVTAPFAPETIAARPIKTGFFQVLLGANAHLDVKDKIPNQAGLEAAVDDAFAKLVQHWNADARQISRGLFGTDYSRVLRGSRRFLATEGMRRQFAKLFILWRIKSNATHPAVFRIPFNSNMFINYIDKGIILTEGNRFDTNAEGVTLAFEAIQRDIVKRVHELIDKTKDAERAAWRDAEKKDITARKLDWTWWIYYRSDTQAYADARGYTSQKWKRQGEVIVAAKDA